jgi:hypothetical protein
MAYLRSTDNRDTVKGPEHRVLKRAKPPRQSNKQIKPDSALSEFFTSLEYNTNQDYQGTVRASYKSGNMAYNLYAIPG